jgi:hypothetical protein
LHHPATLVSLAATRWKLQLPVFKHPLEPLRTTVLPSTSQPPYNINLRNLNSLQRNKVIQWLTSLVAVLLHCSTLSASVSSAPSLHFLFFSIYTLCIMSLSCNLPLLCISTPVLCLLAHTSILLHSDHNNSNSNGNSNLISSLHSVLIVSVHLVHAMCATLSCSHRAHVLHLSSALPDTHGNSSASLALFTRVQHHWVLC